MNEEVEEEEVVGVVGGKRHACMQKTHAHTHPKRENKTDRAEKSTEAAAVRGD